MNATQIRMRLPETAWRRLETELGMPALLVTPARTLDDVMPAPGRMPPPLLEELSRLMGSEQVRGDLAARTAHTKGLVGQLRLRQGDLGAVPDAVVYPRREDDVVALLRLCADAGVAVGTPQVDDAVHVALDLSALGGVEDIDALSGQVRAGAGLTVAALDSELAARGLMLEAGAADRACTLAAWARDAAGLRGIRLATPKGLVVVEDDPAMAALLAGHGVATALTLAVRRRPPDAEPMAWRFADFAAGLAALREAALGGIALIDPILSDERESDFHASLEPAPNRLALLWARLRKQAAGGALLQARMARGGHARFTPIARRLGARPCAAQARVGTDMLDTALLEHGAAWDRMGCRAPWSRLPVLYAAARTALETAMAQHAPREGARGLVMAALSAPDAHGAYLTIHWLFARKLGGDVAQAKAIRAGATAVLTPQEDALSQAVRDAITGTLDPGGTVQ